MNFYKRYVGDIQRDTGHLSLAEFGAYDRLLDHYYATESALPSDIDACCRISRAMSKDERKAVISILNQYFELTDRGYEQKRAEKEIAEAQPAMVAARLNGSKGGRPKKIENKTKEKPSGFSENNPSNTQHESSPEPEPYKPNELTHTVENITSYEITPVGSVCVALKKLFDSANKALTDMNQSEPSFIACIEAGATVDEFLTAGQLAIEKNKGFSYLVGIVVRQRQQATNLNLYKGQLPATTSRESGRQVAASSVFTPENTQHLQGVQLKTINEVIYEQTAITA
jgi:uncharacterized protein YdaU (DUF1376 family)